MRKAQLNAVAELNYHGEEAFNSISTNLSFVGPDVRKIVITSNVQSEGKSFVSMQMVKNLARRGKRVCLVDADLRRSFMMQRTGFAADGQPLGLAHYLSGQCRLEDVLYQTNLYDACMIPTGSTVNAPMGLLDSDLFRSLLDTLSEMFEYVIVDAPPVGMVIDAAEIAKQCDGIIFVAEYNQTSRRELIEAKHKMEQSGTRIIGCILNKVSFDGMSAKHYYNKGYYKHYNSEYYKK